MIETMSKLRNAAKKLLQELGREATLEEVAKLLRLHKSTVCRYAKTGKLRSYLIGNRRLFKSDDVWAFFENQVDRECVFGKEA